jgi:predicted enzyme related to lactoylglutathione lyase
MEVQSLTIGLNSAAPEKLQKFYVDVIGLKHYPDTGGLMAATTGIFIDGHSDLAGPTKEPPRTMWNFAVDDVETAQARLEAAGVKILGCPSQDPISFSTFVDPDGNYGQIFSMEGAPGDSFFALQRTSDNPERLREFYRNVVGLSDDHPELGSPFLAGESAIYMGEHSDVHGHAKEPARAILNFFVDDLAAEQKRIEGHGVIFSRTAGREPWGGVISTFPDPDGNLLQLIEFKP